MKKKRIATPDHWEFAFKLVLTFDLAWRVRGEWESYLRLIDSCTTQLKAQGPSRTCNESKEEEEWETAQRRYLKLTRIYESQQLN